MNDENKSEKFFSNGLKLFEQKEYLKAKRKFDYAIKYDDQNPIYYFLRAKTLFYLNRKKECLEDLKSSIIKYNIKINNNPENPKYHNDRASVLEFLGKEFDLETNDFENLGIKLISNEGYEDQADLIVRKFISIYKEALEECNLAVNIDPKNKDYLFHRGSIAKYLLDVMKSDYSCLFRNYFNNNELFEIAIKDCNLILDQEKNNLKAHILKAEIFQSMEKDEEVIKECDNILDIDPNNEDALYLKVSSLQYLKRYEEALEQCDKMLKKYPKNSDAHYFKGTILYFLKRYDESIPEFNIAIQLNQNHFYAHLYKGKSYEKLNKYDEALMEYNIAIEIKPYNVNARMSKVSILKKMEKKEEADKEFSEAVKDNPCVILKQ